MKVRFFVVFLSCVLLTLVGCSSGNKAPNIPTRAYEPEWYGLQGDPEFVFTYGQSEK